MSEQDSSQERTEQPTPKKIRDAKEKGQVSRSREFNGTAIMITAGVALFVFGGRINYGLQDIMRNSYSLSYAQIHDINTMIDLLAAAVTDALWMLSPVLGVLLLAALLAPLLVGGWVFTGKTLLMDLSKLNPLKGLKKIFSARAIIELLKALAKVLVVAVIAVMLFYNSSSSLMELRLLPLDNALESYVGILLWAFLALSSGMVLIAAVDIPVQAWQHTKQLKMTFQEIRDEYKETEGKPEVKSQIRKMQQQIANARMMDAVPQADVVITNPTHVAVALRYDQVRMQAPIVVAKGEGLIAASIRRIASENKVPMVESPLLARTLNVTTDLGKEIPAALYMAVAQMLTFVFQLKAAKRRGNTPPQQPAPDIPEDFIVALRKVNKNL